MKTMITSLILGTQILSLQASEVEPEVKVEEVIFNGSGCPVAEESAHFPGDDYQVIYFKDFVADTFTASSLRDLSKSCQLTVTPLVPEGYQVAIESFRLRYFYYLDGAISAKVSASTYVQGARPSTTIETSIVPDYGWGEDYVDRTFYFHSHELQYTPCSDSRALNLKLSTRVIEDRTDPHAYSDGFLIVYSAEDFTYRLRKCD